jgi:DNA repair protein RadA/Sms
MMAISRVLSREKPSLCVVDSLQSLYSSRIKSRVGSPSQLITCANALVRAAQSHGISVLVVAHMTKDASLAGPRTVEHDVDAMLYFEADEKEGDKRILYATKNRFGPAFVPAAFRMTMKGLRDAPDDE